MMGATIVVLWLAALLIAMVLWRQPLADRATVRAIQLGSAVGLAGLAVGFLMVRPTGAQLAGQVTDTVGAHSVGVPDGGPHLPVTGWAASGGHLRIAHFVGMHALQVLPLLALALTFAAGRYGWAVRAVVRTRLVLVVGAGYAVLVALTTWALREQPLTSPDAATLAAAAGLAIAMVVGVALALRGGAAGAGRVTVSASAVGR
ncbi:hypothetical protein [Streptomyces sp. NPDC048269]|uniref:hypothetical protein n=1 Tax=Streptomyces sp. NPDC048269 TaxID=3155753 RepID=UPI00343CC919